jgi:type I restriction enzyme M protein
VRLSDVDQTTFDLSAKNPNTPEEAPLRQPNEILEAMVTLDKETADVMNDLKLLIGYE